MIEGSYYVDDKRIEYKTIIYSIEKLQITKLKEDDIAEIIKEYNIDTQHIKDDMQWVIIDIWSY